MRLHLERLRSEKNPEGTEARKAGGRPRKTREWKLMEKCFRKEETISHQRMQTGTGKRGLEKVWRELGRTRGMKVERVILRLVVKQN